MGSVVEAFDGLPIAKLLSRVGVVEPGTGATSVCLQLVSVITSSRTLAMESRKAFISCREVPTVYPAPVRPEPVVFLEPCFQERLLGAGSIAFHPVGRVLSNEVIRYILPTRFTTDH